MKVLLCFALCMLTPAYALVGNTCESESDCDEGECCQIVSRIEVVSRRDAVGVMPIEEPTSGTCQLYLAEGDSCSFFDNLNGYCGCGPGLFCHTYEKKLKKPKKAPKRDEPVARPGYYWVSKCERIL